MESIVIGTAGHIDHGKTTLVRALTGQDTDTLKEEKQRGITVNLGFAYFKLPGGKTAGIVDVPGHERLIKNMLAGAGGIDIAMLVIDANEGVMPQTREHINILSFLNIKESIVVLTKIDNADEELLELVLDDTKDYLSGTFLKDAEIIPVDSISGKGIDVLTAKLDDIAGRVEKKGSGAPMRMPVDRVFSVKGFGTVVTGTLTEGAIKLEDEVTVYPGEKTAKIRSIQVHETSVESSHAGQRTALNLAGLSADEAPRGSVIAKTGSVFMTGRSDVKLRLVEELELDIKRKDTLKAYLGSSEVKIKLHSIDGGSIKSGDEAYAQMIFEEDVPLRRGDRFVLRSLTPVLTVGGGEILDPCPRSYRKITDEIRESFKIKDEGEFSQVLAEFSRCNPFKSAGELEMLSGGREGSKELKSLVVDGILIHSGGKYIHRSFLKKSSESLNAQLKEYHEEYPLRPGIPKTELYSRQRETEDQRNFEWLLQRLEDAGEIKSSQGIISARDFSPTLKGDMQKLKDEILADVEKAAYSPLTAPELTGGIKGKEQMLEALLGEELMTLPGQTIISIELYNKAKELALGLMEEKGAIKLSDFRDSINTSRKYALLILEKFDSEKFTRRVGEDRVLFSKL